MDQTLINRYQSGGDIYASIQAAYGTGTADNIASIATSTGDRVAVANALNIAKNGAPLNTSTTEILASQLYNSTFQAPIEQASKVLNNAISSAGTAAKSAVKAVGDASKGVAGAALGNWGAWVIGAMVLAVMFFYLGGGSIVRRKISKL